jgi:hypothetical protein
VGCVDFSIERDAVGEFALKLATDQWEINVRAPAADFLRLAGIRSAVWKERRSIQAGESAGAHAYWASTGDHAALMIGQDDETWDITLTLPFEVLEEIVEDVRRLTNRPTL